MRLRHIEVFHAVYNTGSITNAAEMLHVSQPAVSKVLHHAELQLGFELFHRIKGNRLVPTSDAKVLIEEVNKVYQQINSLKKVARNLRDNIRGHISIAVMPAFGLDILPRSIQRFREEFPDVTFNVSTRHYNAAVAAVFEYDCDFSLVFNPHSHPGMEEIDLGTAEMVCVYPAGKFPDDQGPLALADIKDLELISINDSGPLGDLVEAEFAKEDISLNSVIQAETYYTAKNLVRYGQGVAILDEITARAAAGVGVVEFRPLQPQLQFSVKALSLESKPLSKVCRDFLQVLKSEYERFVS